MTNSISYFNEVKFPIFEQCKYWDQNRKQTRLSFNSHMPLNVPLYIPFSSWVEICVFKCNWKNWISTTSFIGSWLDFVYGYNSSFCKNATYSPENPRKKWLRLAIQHDSLKYSLYLGLSQPYPLIHVFINQGSITKERFDMYLSSYLRKYAIYVYCLIRYLTIEEKNLREDFPWGSVVIILMSNVQATITSIMSSAKI